MRLVTVKLRDLATTSQGLVYHGGVGMKKVWESRHPREPCLVAHTCKPCRQAPAGGSEIKTSSSYMVRTYV